ncbi:MAG TPA: hypothetical protein VHO91_00540, partial [Rhodopila sp.]|nr:hypothetical protein [Rhodopila sp.]
MSASAPQASSSSPILLDLVTSQLMPLFLDAAGHDPARARAAALEAINGHNSRSSADLLLAAQLIAFSLVALSTLMQSMAPGVHTETALRLRSRANSLSLAANRSRRALEGPQRTAHRRPGPSRPAPHAGATATIDTTAADIAAADNATAWAKAFTEAAQDVDATLPALPAAQLRSARIQAAALGQAASLLHSSALSAPAASGLPPLPARPVPPRQASPLSVPAQVPFAQVPFAQVPFAQAPFA